MGFASSLLDREWNAPDKSVCDQCVEDEFLKSTIRANATEKKCDYCGRISDKNIAAPVEVILEPIASTLFAHFREPVHSGMPRNDGEWLCENDIVETWSVLDSIGLNCNEDLLTDIDDSFGDRSWIKSPNGHWLGKHEHEELKHSWARFDQTIKHKSRYFFLTTSTTDQDVYDEDYSPAVLLEKIGELAERLSLIKIIAQGTVLYRVRCSDSKSKYYSSFEELGPPPAEIAGAGRMNPPGISYFYLSFEQETALAEVMKGPPCNVSIGKFSTREELLYLDLTELPPTPSDFDRSHSEEREGLLFLKEFVGAITKRVYQDGREHIDYLPSQVISEYFAQVFRAHGNQQLDGIAYHSVKRAGGINLVIFPRQGYEHKWSDRIELVDASGLHLKT